MNVSPRAYVMAARAYVAAGVSVVPGRTDEKMPDLRMGELAIYKLRLPGDDELQHWFDKPRRIIAVTGSISGYLEILDFDDDAETVFPQWYQSVESIARWLPVVETPGGGYHVWYRCSVISGSKVIAKSEAGTVRIESKGERSACTAPGGVCLLGENPRVQVSGPPLPFDIPVISESDRVKLWAAARAFDLGGIKEQAAAKARKRLKFQTLSQRPRPVQHDGTTPWDDYNARCNGAELLESIGWKSANGLNWTRPGKSHGTSATLRQTQDGGAQVLCVFSSSVSELEPGTHSLFCVYSAYHHNGDKRTAARTLRSQGFGQ